jgi:hypothetical protein
MNISTVTVNRLSADRKSDYYRREITVDNTASAVYQTITNVAVLNQGTNADIVTNITGNVFIPQAPETFQHDLDGNLTNDGPKVRYESTIVFSALRYNYWFYRVCYLHCFTRKNRN